jgi:uncharacterized protein (DUF488 family)
LVRSFGVDLLIDVRSQPHSGRAPQFNREALERVSGDMSYRWMPELGGRPSAHLRTDSGAPDYERMAQEPDTMRALDEVVSLAGTHTVALMCSESRPDECHRSRMLEPELAQRGVWVEHILHSGDVAAKPTLFA